MQIGTSGQDANSAAKLRRKFDQACVDCTEYARQHLAKHFDTKEQEVLQMVGYVAFVQAIAFDDAWKAKLFDPDSHL